MDAEDAHQWSGPQLIGIGVGNGCTGTERGICGYYFGSHCDGLYYEYKFLSGFSFISDAIKHEVDDSCRDEWDACKSPSSTDSSGDFPLSQLCINALDKGMKLLGYINIYNVLGDCSFNSCPGPVGTEPVGRVGRRADVSKLTRIARSLEQKQQLQQLGAGLGAAPPVEFDDTVAQITDSGPAECIDSVDASNYMNDPEVQKALHAHAPGYCWAVCNHHQGWKYTSTRTDLPRDTYPRLVSRLKVVIYNGDMDACKCDALGGGVRASGHLNAGLASHLTSSPPLSLFPLPSPQVFHTRTTRPGLRAWATRPRSRGTPGATRAAT